MEFYKSKRNKVLAGLGALIGTLALATGCGESGPEIHLDVPGEVTGHMYDDRDVWITYIFTGRTTIPITNVDPEHFYLKVRQCDHPEFESPENPEGCAVFTKEVSASTYGSFAVGDSIVFRSSE